MRWYLRVLRHYADFSGRARRTEYWLFTLVSLVISIGTFMVDHLLGMEKTIAGQYGPATLVYLLAVLVPTLAVGARRLHDTGRRGWWQLMWPIPVLNIALLLMLCGVSRPGTNRWGPNPLCAHTTEGAARTPTRADETPDWGSTQIRRKPAIRVCCGWSVVCGSRLRALVGVRNW
ncbi:MAG: DUF805 domain-containing protein [Pseudonocardiales bacterium]|nr:DUF805 domain-containing protein [Pseudonocardiales bacterium]